MQLGIILTDSGSWVRFSVNNTSSTYSNDGFVDELAVPSPSFINLISGGGACGGDVASNAAASDAAASANAAAAVC